MRKCYNSNKKTQSQAAYPLIFGGATLQTKERRVMPMYVTYSDLIQIGLFIIGLVALIYEITRKK